MKKFKEQGIFPIMSREKKQKYSLLRQGKIRFLDKKKKEIFPPTSRGKLKEQKNLEKMKETKKIPSYVKGKVDFLLEF